MFNQQHVVYVCIQSYTLYSLYTFSHPLNPDNRVVQLILSLLIITCFQLVSEYNNKYDNLFSDNNLISYVTQIRLVWLIQYLCAQLIFYYLIISRITLELSNIGVSKKDQEYSFGLGYFTHFINKFQYIIIGT